MTQKILIVYNSQTGFTERYARWLGEEVACELVPYAKRDSVNLADYSAVVFGGWFHAGSIKGLKWFREKLPQLSGKTVAVFATGSAPANEPQAKEALANNALTLDGKAVAMFYFEGGLCYEKMSVGNRLLMKMFSKMIKKQYGADSDIYKCVSTSHDESSKDAITPLVQYLKEHQ